MVEATGAELLLYRPVAWCFIRWLKFLNILMFCVELLLGGCGEKEVRDNYPTEDGPSCEACADCCASEVETPTNATETSKEAQEEAPTKVPNREVSIDKLEKRDKIWYVKGETCLLYTSDAADDS